jgi:2,3-bisphosphoglycerate-dependent phosphoglycerate mutase
VAELILVRHGETDWNRDLRYQGHADPPLNDAGRAQAHELARELDGLELDAIYTSDLRRASETAEIIHAGRDIPLRREAGLREIDVGSWSGLTRTEIEERFPGVEIHDGETPEAHRARVVGTVAAIAARHDGARILIVSHGGSLRALLAHALRDDSVPRVENCAIYRLAFRDGVLRGID